MRFDGIRGEHDGDLATRQYITPEDGCTAEVITDSVGIFMLPEIRDGVSPPPLD